MSPPQQPLLRYFCVFLFTIVCLSTLITKKDNYEEYLDQFNSTSDVSDSDFFILDDRQTKEKSGKPPRLRLTSLRPKYSNFSVNNTIYFLGLFELSTRWGHREESVSEVRAAELAVKHVNAHRIIPGYSLELLVNDTKCDPGVGVDRFFHAIYSKKPIVMLLGTSCSNVTERLANVVPYWNILQVSFGSKSPVLSDRKKFPLFFRTVTPDSSHNAARISFIKHFGWEAVATFSQSENAFLLPINRLITQLEKVNVTSSTPITFSLDNYREQLRILKGLDTRIIVGSFSSKAARKIFCEVLELKMYGTDYVWILQDNDWEWWKAPDPCTPTLNGAFFVSHHNFIIGNETAISGLTNEMFEKELNFSGNEPSKYARQTYDAVWAMGLSLRQSSLYSKVHLREFHYKQANMTRAFASSMQNLNFMGISGPVMFDGADRIGNTVFKQMQDGRMETVAVYYAEHDFMDFACAHCKKLVWPSGQIPIARRILKIRLITVPKPAFVVIAAVSALGIVASFAFLYFNLHFRRKKSVKLSSPRLNNVAVSGCIIVYASVILLGLDDATLLSKEHFSRVCIAKVYMLSAGFSLAFGSMFAKTYRVNKIFTYSTASVVKDKFLKDRHLITLILMLLIVDGVIVALWIMIDPMKRYLHSMALENSSKDRGVVYQPQVEVCRSNNTTGWFIAIYGYKGFLLIMGVYMAWESRHVKVALLNESQYIGISVYSAFSCAVIVVLSNFLTEYPTFSYIATTTSILASTTVTLFLLFLPKLKSVFGRVESEDPIMQSMGLKFECNTRRMATDDARELAYRMEVQNKVYKCELSALDAEIARLEELLSGPSPNTNDIYAISKADNAPIVLLAVPQSSTSRASWPFCSTDTLKMRKLKEIFGSIPSIFTRSENDAVRSGLPQDATAGCSGGGEEESAASPEFVTRKLMLSGDEYVEYYAGPRFNDENEFF